MLLKFEKYRGQYIKLNAKRNFGRVSQIRLRLWGDASLHARCLTGMQLCGDARASTGFPGKVPPESSQPVLLE